MKGYGVRFKKLKNQSTKVRKVKNKDPKLSEREKS